MSETLILTKDLIVAKGSGRVCYNHPKDFSKIIKIAYLKFFIKIKIKLKIFTITI